MTNNIKEPVPLVRAHLVEGFDARRAKLFGRIKILSSFTGVTMGRIADELGIRADQFSHMMSGRRNSYLAPTIDAVEEIVARHEAEAEEAGIRLPK